MLAHAVDEVDRDADAIRSAVELARAFCQAVRRATVEVRRTVVREYPHRLPGEGVPVIDGDERLVCVAVLTVLQASGLGCGDVPEPSLSEGRENEVAARREERFRERRDRSQVLGEGAHAEREARDVEPALGLEDPDVGSERTLVDDALEATELFRSFGGRIREKSGNAGRKVEGLRHEVLQVATSI